MLNEFLTALPNKHNRRFPDTLWTRPIHASLMDPDGGRKQLVVDTMWLLSQTCIEKKWPRATRRTP